MAEFGATAIRHLINTLGRFRTTSVLAPLQVLGIIVVIPFIIVMWLAGADHSLTWMFSYLFAAVVVVALLSFCIWSFANPDRLQTEEYRIEQQRLIGDERQPGAGAVLIDNAPLTSNTGPTT
jgi:hypothetical protein